MQAPGNGEVVDLVDSDEDGGVRVMSTAAAAGASSSAARAGGNGGGGGGGKRRRGPAAASAGVVELLDDDDDDDDEVIIVGGSEANSCKQPPGPSPAAKGKGRRRAPASTAASASVAAAIDVSDDYEWGGAAALPPRGGEEDDDAWRLQLPPESCEECGMQDHVVRLGGCGHGVCLFCLRRPYEDLVLTADDELPVLRCPVSACGRSLLGAADALHLLAPADFDVYAKQRLKAFKAQMSSSSSSSSSSSTKAIVPCLSCGRKPRIPKTGGGGGEVSVVAGSKRKRESTGGGSGGGGSKPAAWEKALEAAEPPSPLVLECAGGCNLLYCQLCRTTLAPASAHQGWRGAREKEGGSGGCACLALGRLAALEAATGAMLEEMQRERKGKGGKGKAQASAGGGAQQGKWAAGTGFGGSSSSSGGGGYYGYGDDYDEGYDSEDYDEDDWDGAGYDRHRFGHKKEAQPSKAETEAKARQEKDDAAIRSLLGRWRQALPKGPMQQPILPETQHLLARAFSKDHGAVSSPLLRLLRMLLLNDSVMDMTARSQVYQSALDVVQALSAHPLVAPVLERAIDDEAEEEEDDEGQRGGGKKPAASSSGGSGGGGGGVASSSLLGVLGRLHTQAAFHVKCGGKAMGAQIASSQEEALFQDLTLSTKIIDTHDAVTRALEQHRQVYFLELQAYHQVGGKLGHAEGYSEEEGKAQGGKGKEKTPRQTAKAKAAQEEAEAEEAYKRELGALRLESVALLTRVSKNEISYSFTNQANQGPGPTGAINRIMREITTLQTSLPVEYGAGIWIRVDEDKPHVMKVLISGPMDTPYAQGLFEFDILLPANYPNSPPQVLLVTTGGGQFRFNPNLYACGKVCLSLLGTWAGPGWEPGKSTLLQVLISIQSLIMVPEPMFNEPGYERELNTPAGTQHSNQYNAVIRRGTLQYAVLQQLQRPSPVFEDVIKKHFALRRRQLLAQCDKWLGQDRFFPQGPRQNAHGAGGGPAIDMAATVRQIKALL